MFSGTRADLFSVGNTSAGAVYVKSRSICTGLWCRYGLVARTVGQNQVEDQSLRQISLCKNPPRQDCKSWVYWNRFCCLFHSNRFKFCFSPSSAKKIERNACSGLQCQKGKKCLLFCGYGDPLGNQKAESKGPLGTGTTSNRLQRCPRVSLCFSGLQVGSLRFWGTRSGMKFIPTSCG